MGTTTGSSGTQELWEPYASTQELVSDHVDSIGMRARTALDRQLRVARGESLADDWPLELLAAELRVAQRARNSKVDNPIARVRDRFVLSPNAERALWALFAYEHSPVVRQLMRELSTEPGQDPTLDVVRRVVYGAAFSQDAWFELGPESMLQRFGFMERTDSDDRAPLHRQHWKLSTRTMRLLHGDPRVAAGIAARLHPGSDPGDAVVLADGVCARISEAFDDASLLVACGAAGSGRRTALVRAAQARGLAVLEFDARMLDRDCDRARVQLRGIARECRLFGATPLLLHLESLAASSDSGDRLDIVESELCGLALATAAFLPVRRWCRPPTRVDLPELSRTERAAVWAARGGAPEQLPSDRRYAPAIIAAVAQATGGPGERVPEDRVIAALDIAVAERFAGLASRYLPRSRDRELKLGGAEQEAFDALCANAQCHETRGRASDDGASGLVALFTGRAGIGKKRAAFALARRLRVPMFRGSVHRLTASRAGDTTSRFAALLDAAEATQALLYVEHADALLAPRADLWSGRYRASSLVPFLVERLEQFTGICVFAAEEHDAVDALLRRKFAVHIQYSTTDGAPRSTHRDGVRGLYTVPSPEAKR